MTGHRTVEGLAAGAIGAAMAALSAPRRMRRVAVAAAAVNGLVSGLRGTYDWSRPPGVAAFVLDSSWSVAGTVSGLCLAAFQALAGDAGYRPELSRRRNRHVYAGGFRLQPGFALTAGQVVSNAAGRSGIDGDGAAAVRRRRFVTRHEELHIWQQRGFGPLYPVVYGLWTIGAGCAGVLLWVRRGGDLRRTVMTLAYYDNPFEVWAYRNDGYWPPSAADPALIWRARTIAPSTPDRSPKAAG